MPNILLECGQIVYYTGDTTATVPVTLVSTDLKKASKSGLLKGSVKNRHISITLYNDEINVKIEGAAGETCF